MKRDMARLEFVYKGSSVKCACSSSRSVEFLNSGDSFLEGICPFDRKRKHIQVIAAIGDTYRERKRERERPTFQDLN